MRLAIHRIRSPMGDIDLVSDGEALRALEFADCELRLRRLLGRHYGDCQLVPSRGVGPFGDPVLAYLHGDLKTIDDIEVRTGGTEFQRAVWAALRRIPAGTTTTYGALAGALGRDARASRAVGLANGANPVAIVIPCHRLIGADGSLTGYAGGLERKRWLLRHEGALERGCRSGG